MLLRECTRFDRLVVVGHVVDVDSGCFCQKGESCRLGNFLLNLKCWLYSLRLLVVHSEKKSSEIVVDMNFCVDVQRLELDRQLDLVLLVLGELFLRIVDLEAMQRLVELGIQCLVLLLYVLVVMILLVVV